MSLGIRGRLFGVSVALILIGVVASGAVLESNLRGWLEARIESELLRDARSAGVALTSALGVGGMETIDALADQLGGAAEVRVTVIDQAGGVLGDSALTLGELRGLENHADRSEVIAARAEGWGRSSRWSDTLGVEMLYVAVAYEAGVVRCATPLSQVDEVAGRLRGLVVAAGLAGLLVAAAMSGLASKLVSQRLRTLTAERDYFGAVLEVMEAAVIAMDAQQRVTVLNPRAREMLALTVDPTGQRLIDAVSLPGLAELLEGATTQPVSAELELGGPTRRVGLARLSPRSASGGAVLVIHDMTELRRLEALRRDFVANVSHELRTPLSVIQANAETLLDGALEAPEMAVKFTDGILRHSERLSRLVADLLDLSRIEVGQYPLAIQPLAVADCAAGAVDTVASQAEARGMSLSLAIPEGLKARGDAQALEQILLNFVDNAVKYTPDGGAVVVRARAVAGVVRVEVEDNGPGVPEAHRARLFERFYRVDPGRSRAVGGTGLGLAIVKHLAAAMRGRVGMASAPEGGAIFWLEIPRERGAE